MTDQPPFVPPAAPPPPPALASGSPTLPPPTGAPRPGPEPPASAGRPARRTLRIAIIAGAALLVAALLVGASALTISALDGLFATQDDGVPAGADDADGDVDEGEQAEEPTSGGDGDGPGDDDSAQTPFAVTPLECDACFGESHIGEVIPTDALLEELGLSIPFGAWGDYPPYRAGPELDFQAAGWARDSGSDEACFFTYPASPVGPTAAGVGSRDDLVEYLGSYTDTKSVNSIAQSLRIFSSSESAVAYLTALDDAIPGCDSYSLASGWEPIVTPAPRLTLPDDVAAIGFVESLGSDALHVVNLQRGNLVVHVSLWTGRGGPTADQFRAFVEGLAVQLSEIAPRD